MQFVSQVVAAINPLEFCQLRLMKPVFYFCLFLEMTGVTHICWVLSYLLSISLGLKKFKRKGKKTCGDEGGKVLEGSDNKAVTEEDKPGP